MHIFHCRQNGYTALNMAVLNRKHLVAQLLLGFGADVEMVRGKVSWACQSGVPCRGGRGWGCDGGGGVGGLRGR